MAESLKCQSCNAEIEFIEIGFKDAEKKQKNVCPVNVPVQQRWVLVGGKYVLAKCWQSHFETCPNAQQHRQPRQQPQAPATADEFGEPW